ncbi:hypothetical protein, partial [Xanthovirga aplysinae]|uniref:hypothetical protein n=1 Tax=Xanthovirga aplysinae TaxID=2529853 RepID=UPI0016574694
VNVNGDDNIIGDPDFDDFSLGNNIIMGNRNDGNRQGFGVLIGGDENVIQGNNRILGNNNDGNRQVKFIGI